MNASKRFKISGIISTALLVLASVIGVVSDLKNLSDKYHALPIVLLLLASAGVVTAALMWHNYSLAIKGAEAKVSAPNELLSLGAPRGEAELAREVRRMMAKKGISEIDIGGLALRSQFFRKRSPFSEQLLALLRSNMGVRVRIWLLDPRSEAVQMREFAERQKRDGLLNVACRESLETLRDIVLTIWREQQKRRPEVVLVDQVAVGQFIFRVDDEMIVTLYLQHDTGNASPTFCLKIGENWFEAYKKQFDLCYKVHAANLYPSEEDLSKEKAASAL